MLQVKVGVRVCHMQYMYVHYLRVVGVRECHMQYTYVHCGGCACMSHAVHVCALLASWVFENPWCSLR